MCRLLLIVRPPVALIFHRILARGSILPRLRASLLACVLVRIPISGLSARIFTRVGANFIRFFIARFIRPVRID